MNFICTWMQSMACKQAQEIPGYYYDEKRRRYFRIPPSSTQHSFNPAQPVQSPVKALDPNTSSVKKTHSHRIYDFVIRRQHDANLSTRLLYECIASSVKKGKGVSIGCKGSGQSFNNIAMNHRGDILAMKKTAHSGTSNIWDVVKIDGDLHHRKIYSLLKVPTKQEGTYTSLDFLSPEEDGADHFLFLRSPREIMSCKIFSKNRYSRSPEENDTYMTDYCVRVKDFVCTAMWNKTQCEKEQTSLNFVIGCHNGTVRVRNNHRELSHFQASWKSPVLSLGCNQQSPLLYAGYRNGVIAAWDLRARGRCAWSVKEPPDGKVASSIIWLHPLTDGNYLISNAFNSNLSLWDVRMKSKTMMYKGHTNTYKDCKSILDRTESFVAAAGSDQSVCLWSLWTGEMLQSINCNDELGAVDLDDAAPHPPVICYSENFGGRYTNPVLLIAHDGALSTYSINGNPSF